MKALLVVTAAAIAAAPVSAEPPRPPQGIALPVDCGAAVCVINRAALMEILKVHNAHVDEIQTLRTELERRKPCVERNS